MTTADLTSEPGAHGKPREHESPVAPAAWLLRTAALTAVFAGFAAVVVLPGLRGTSENADVVLWAGRVTSTLAYFLLGLLAILIVRGGAELARGRGRVPAPMRIVLLFTSGLVVLTAVMACKERLQFWLSLLIMATSTVTTLVAAYAAVLKPHTRAPAGLLLALAFATMTRLWAWDMAARASEHADLTLFHWSQGLATAGVLFEAFGQLVAVTWLGTKSRLAGQVGSTAALVVAFWLTWGVARGEAAGAAPWQYVLHSALADAPGLPPPLGLDALATFLVPASLLLALVAALQPNQVTAVAASVALALVSHGLFDAPLRALCIVAASLWLTIASDDDWSMWQSLLQGGPIRPAL